MFSMDSPEIVKALIEKGADVNLKNRDTGRSILMLMVLGDEIENVKGVLDKAADVNARDDQGITALMLAATNNKNCGGESLIAKGH